MLICGFIPLLLLVHWRRGNREAGILLIPSMAEGLSLFVVLLANILEAIPATASISLFIIESVLRFRVGPFSIALADISGLGFVLSLSLIIVLRSIRISRQQALLEGELEAARQIQQLILPDQIETIPGFSVESVYLPAQQVGGDFFQILPLPGEGLLLVIGDVAGKGLPAAMLVSVLVGAVRTAAEYTLDPEELLDKLNERLVERSRGGFSTALIARIDCDGTLTIANAGHLSPYLNGREMELPGALPLGIQTGIHYEVSRFELAPDDRLTFYSDGVVEAQNKNNELFGFERSSELSTRPAAEVAAAAQRFGQQDDITVLSIVRTAVPHLAIA